MQTTELLNGKRATTRVAPTCAALLLALFFCAGLRAQVTIGGLTEPQKGAILDLNSDVKGGLVLSNVTITNPERIPHGTNVFLGINDSNDHDNQELRGAMVYNDGNGTIVPPGVYIWNGHCWTNDGRDIIVTAPVITIDGAIKSAAVTNPESAAVTLAVASPQPDVSYEWYQNTIASNTGGESVGTTGETYTTPDDPEVATYYYCKATSLACPSVNAVSGVITVVVLDPALSSGPGNLTGLNTFDIAFSTHDNCGTHNAIPRSPAKRSFTADFTEEYTFSGATVLFFDFRNSDAAHPVIKSLEQNGNIVTVTFHKELDTWAQGLTRANELKAELYAVYEGNQSTMLTLRVSDCQYCPGLLVVGGEYVQYSPRSPASFPAGVLTVANSNQNGSAAEALLDNSTPTGYDLCYYKHDATFGTAGSSSTYQWNTGTPNAMNVCQTTQGVDAADDHDDWRLPNIAELAQIGQLVSSYTAAAINTGVGSQTHVNAAISGNTGYNDVIALPGGSYTTTGTYNLISASYWSSTEENTSNAYLWTFSVTNRYALNNLKTYSIHVRCVRRFY